MIESEDNNNKNCWRLGMGHVVAKSRIILIFTIYITSPI